MENTPLVFSALPVGSATVVPVEEPRQENAVTLLGIFGEGAEKNGLPKAGGDWDSFRDLELCSLETVIGMASATRLKL